MRTSTLGCSAVGLALRLRYGTLFAVLLRISEPQKLRSRWARETRHVRAIGSSGSPKQRPQRPDGEHIRCRLPRAGASFLDQVRRHRDSLLRDLKAESRSPAEARSTGTLKVQGEYLPDQIGKWSRRSCAQGWRFSAQARFLFSDFCT